MKTTMQEMIDWATMFEDKMISANQVVLKAQNLLILEQKQLRELLFLFWNRHSDACPLEVNEHEIQINQWNNWIAEKYMSNIKMPMHELIEELTKDAFMHKSFGDYKSSEIIFGIRDFIKDVYIEKENDLFKELSYYKTTTVGLWATDRPDLIPENIKDLFFQIKQNV